MDISGLQFALVVAVAPISTLVGALVIYNANNKSGKERATEVKADMNALISQVRNDTSTNFLRLEANIKEIPTDIRASQSDLKEWVRLEIRAALAEMKTEMIKAQRPRTMGAGQTLHENEE